MAAVSVIVPIYKVEDYLEQCVQSIRTQSYADIEIILVDDGSPDRCGQMCDAYAREDDRIVVIHKENGGLGEARNTGVAAAHGEYLMFVDSDDWIHQDTVKILFQEAKKSRADLVLFDYAGVEDGQKITDLFTMEVSENQILDVHTEPKLVICSVSAVNKLYRREFWNQAGIKFPKGHYYEDLGTLPKLFLLAERVVYKKEVLYYYRTREGSIMHSSDFSRNYKDRTAMLEEVSEFYKEKGAWEQYQSELEYLFFENGYFVPSKEIVLNDRTSDYLKKFRNYVYGKFPEVKKNRYVRELSRKDRILFFLLERKWYGIMIFLSSVRQWKEKLK